MTADQAREISEKYNLINKALLEKINRRIQEATENGEFRVEIQLNSVQITPTEFVKVFTKFKGNKPLIVEHFTRLGFMASIKTKSVYNEQLILEW